MARSAAPRYLRSVTLDRASVPGFDRHPFDLPVVKALDVLELRAPVTCLIGENGMGKSTLLEAIALGCGFNAEGGSRNFRFATRESHSELHRHLLLQRGAEKPRTGFFLRAESYYNLATEVDKLGVGHAYGGRSLHEQSHGESFLALFQNRFTRDGLYLLDEPEAALSPQRQLALLLRMHDLVGQGCQFVLATHAPILMAYPGADLLWLDENGATRRSFAEIEHVAVMRRFLADPDSVLRQLLAPGDDPGLR